MLAGIFYGSQYGGAIGAILLNLPSHPPHAVTCLDGYPMTLAGQRRGRARRDHDVVVLRGLGRHHRDDLPLATARAGGLQVRSHRDLHDHAARPARGRDHVAGIAVEGHRDDALRHACAASWAPTSTPARFALHDRDSSSCPTASSSVRCAWASSASPTSSMNINRHGGQGEPQANVRMRDMRPTPRRTQAIDHADAARYRWSARSSAPCRARARPSRRSSPTRSNARSRRRPSASGNGAHRRRGRARGRRRTPRPRSTSSPRCRSAFRAMP